MHACTGLPPRCTDAAAAANAISQLCIVTCAQSKFAESLQLLSDAFKGCKTNGRQAPRALQLPKPVTTSYSTLAITDTAEKSVAAIIDTAEQSMRV